MDEKVAQELLSKFDLRIEPEMSRYVRRQLDESADKSFPVMGGNKFTGVPVRELIDAGKLRAALLES